MPGKATKRVLSTALIAATIAMAGCVSMPQAKRPADATEYAAAVTVERDNFKKHTRYVSFNDGRGFDTLFLRAYKYDDPKMPSLYQIYVADYYDGDWRFYNTAYDSNGKRMDFVQISRDVGACGRYSGCSKTEHLALTVDRAYLESGANTGIQFQVSGKAGSEVFNLTGPAIAGFLKAVPK